MFYTTIVPSILLDPLDPCLHPFVGDHTHVGVAKDAGAALSQEWLPSRQQWGDHDVERPPAPTVEARFRRRQRQKHSPEIVKVGIIENREGSERGDNGIKIGVLRKTC